MSETTNQAPGDTHDMDTDALLAAVRNTFGQAAAREPALFATEGEGMFDAFLAGLPEHERRAWTCHCCRRFVETFGGLVCLDEGGRQTSALWDPTAVPAVHAPGVARMRAMAESRRVLGVFRAKGGTWGVPRTGDWTHFAVDVPRHLRHADRLLTPGQAMAAKREDFATASRALAEFRPDALGTALRLLEAESLARGERFVAPVRWLMDLHARRASAGGRRDNVLWRAVATAPAGFCHPRSSVVGSLLDDIAAGLPFGEVKRRFDAKMHPLLYQRPQAAPAAGNIAQAERIVEQLGLAGALERRFALLEEVLPYAVWSPGPVQGRPPAGGGGVFSHLDPKGSPPPAGAMTVDAPAMTWEKFARTALPGAAEMELQVPMHGNFTALLTAADPDAQPVLRWDREEARNPFSAYVYHGGSPAPAWGLAPGWARVEAVVPRPNLWGADPAPHLGEGVVLVLRGCEDGRTGQGNALFPETLRADLHGVRATIEAFSRRAEIARTDGQKASGYGVGKGSGAIRLRVRAAGKGWTVHTIDRWD